MEQHDSVCLVKNATVREACKRSLLRILHMGIHSLVCYTMDEMFGTLVTPQNQTTAQNVTHFQIFAQRVHLLCSLSCMSVRLNKLNFLISSAEFCLDNQRTIFARCLPCMILRPWPTAWRSDDEISTMYASTAVSIRGLWCFGLIPNWNHLSQRLHVVQHVLCLF